MTVAVTQNFVNQSNFEHVCLDMAPGHCHKGVCRAGLLAVPGKSIQDVENHPPGTMTRWNHPDMTRKEKRLKGSEPVRTSNSVNQCSSFEFSDVHESLESQIFSYDINFLSQFLEKERDHYSSVWSPTNSIGQREAREWLRRLWVLKPELRELIWKVSFVVIYVKFYLVLDFLCTKLQCVCVFGRCYLFLEDALFLVLIDMFVPVGCMPSNKCGQVVCMLRGNKCMP